MKKVLENLGFEVILKTNLTQIQMLDAIDNFTDRLLESQTVGLFYFSGHGANVAGTNYLLPIDNKKIRRARHLGSYAINTHKILKTMERDRSNSINIMILDACRDDPFPNIDRSLSRGLGRINTRGSIIAFATAIGDTTPDNSPNGRNGLNIKETNNENSNNTHNTTTNSLPITTSKTIKHLLKIHKCQFI